MLLRAKILINSVALSIIAVLASSLLIGGLSYNKAKETITLQTQEKLNLLRNLKADELKRYYNILLNQIDSFANNFTVAQALVDFNMAYDKYAKENNLINSAYSREKLNDFIRAYAQQYASLNGGKIVNVSRFLNQTNPISFSLQYKYIINNPNALDQKSNLVSVDDDTTYDKVHKHYHPLFAKYSKRFGIYDIMLVNATGTIVYSVSKELDFATSLVDGIYAKYEVGKIFTQVMDANERNSLQISDYIPYIPSYERQASFICVPIYNKDQKIGAIIFQLAIEQVDKIMTSEQHWEDIGLGKTGEAYLVGADQTFRSSSRFFLENPQDYLANIEKDVDPQILSSIKARNSLIGLQQVDTLAVKQAFLGEINNKEYTNYLGNNVMGSYELLTLYGLNWAIICEIGFNEAFASVYSLASFIFFLSIVVVVIISWIAVTFSAKIAKNISDRLNNFAKVIQNIAVKHDLTVRLSEADDDELKPIAVSLNKLFKSLQSTFQDTFKSFKHAQDTSRARLHEYEDLNNTQTEHIDEDVLEELTQKLDKLSDQFKFFEDQADKTRDWQ